MSLEIPDKPDEDDTSRDGLLSYAVEWHAFTFMLAVGLLLSLPPGPVQSFAVALMVVSATGRGFDRLNGNLKVQLRQEAWYGAAGLVVGIFFGVLLRPAVAILL